MLRKPRFVIGFLTALALGGLVTVAACSDHGEGERCQLDNGQEPVESDSDDCADGLVCRSAAALNVPDIKDTASREGRCCPVDPSKATVAVCAPRGSSTADASIPPEAAAGDAPTDGTSSDGSDAASTPDSPQSPDAAETGPAPDAAPDAPADADDAG